MRTGGSGHGEVVQLYLSGANVTGLTTPVQNLVGFKRVDLLLGQAQEVIFVVERASLETAMGDGSRKVVAGEYTLWAGGHQPRDKEGDAGSSGKCVSTTLQLK